MLKFNFSGYKLECGTDEAGRGCLAGPVTAAAVCLPALPNEEFIKTLQKINDSKQLSEKDRFILKPLIEKYAISFSSHICIMRRLMPQIFSTPR